MMNKRKKFKKNLSASSHDDRKTSNNGQIVVSTQRTSDMSFGGFKLHHWPILTAGWYLLTFAISYNIAVYNEHVVAFLPYISDTGGEPPESCIMGQMMNIGALFMGITIYIRYRQIEYILDSNKVFKLKKLNKITLWLGIVTSLGSSVVGNFQWLNILSIHFVGATMVFGIGFPFLILQTRLSYVLDKIYAKNPQYGIGKSLLLVRYLILAIYGTSLVVTLIAGTMAFRMFKGVNSTWWTPERDGYYIHLVSAFSEWFILFAFLLYTLSGTPEFKLLEFEEIKFRPKYRIITNGVRENGLQTTAK